jgi:hypothetical protein
MKHLILVVLLFTSVYPAFAQGKYFTRTGHIDFFSTTPVEDIKANNNSVTCVLDAETGNIEFAVLMKAFEFKKALMEEHFNENYVESETYPKSKFAGKVLNLREIDLTKEGSYPAVVEGELSLHGITKKVTAKGTMDVVGEDISVSSKFVIKPEDYDIKIPGVVRDKIAEELEISVDVLLKPFKK